MSVFLNDNDLSSIICSSTELCHRQKASKVVLICSSGDGLSSFIQLAHNLGNDPEVAYIYLTHMNKSQPSMVSEILRLRLTFPIKPLDGSGPLMGGTIYVPLANKDVEFTENGVMVVPPSQRVAPSFDKAVTSASKHFKEDLVVLILSGKTDDGVEALKQLSIDGGKVLVQGPCKNKPQMSTLAYLLSEHVGLTHPQDLAKELKQFI